MPRKPATKASYSPSEIKQLMSKTGSEKTLQNMVVKDLKKLGFIVVVTNAGIRTEAAAGLKKGKGAVFATPGMPDLFVRHPKWKTGTYLAIELKTSTGKLSPAQKVIHELGGSFVCRSLDDVMHLPGISFWANLLPDQTYNQPTQPNDYQSTNPNTDRNGQQLDECA